MTEECLVHYADSDPRLEGALDTGQLPAAVTGLYQAEVDAGAVAYDATRLEFYRYTAPGQLFDLSVQFNPGRAARPFDPGECPVCLPTLRTLGRQRYLAIRVNGRPYIVLANTFPVMPAALVILSEQHLPQTLDPRPDPRPGLWQEPGVDRVVRDIAALARDLPGYVVIFNGRHAGASLAHFHFQAFRLPDGHGPLGLYRLSVASASRWLGYADDYPLAVHCAQGKTEHVIASTVKVATAWCAVQGAAASANLIATAGPEGVNLCFVPRNGLFRVGLLGGPLGAIEVSGLTVCSSARDRDRIRSGDVNFELLWRNLAFVRPQAVDEWRARCAEE